MVARLDAALRARDAVVALAAGEAEGAEASENPSLGLEEPQALDRQGDTAGRPVSPAASSMLTSTDPDLEPQAPDSDMDQDAEGGALC